MIKLVLGLGLCGTALAYISYHLIVDRLGAVIASGVTYVPPVVALPVGTLMVGEPVQGIDLLAMAAILVGVGVLQSGRSGEKPATGSGQNVRNRH